MAWRPSRACSTSDAAGTSTGAVVASFAGDNNYKPTQATGDIVNSQASTTTTLASSANPSVSGQSVTFTATVAAASPGSGTPTGTVNFLDGTTTIGSGTLNSSGEATFSTSTLTVGTHSITAVYAGDTNFTTSTSTAVSQVVQPGGRRPPLTSGTNPSVSGQSVTFTATVAAASPGSGTPTGTVNFLDGTTTIGTGTLNSSGVATFSTSTLTSVGTHSITAVYSGDTNFATSTSSAVSQVVNQASTTTARCTNPVRHPSVSGQSVTFTATVAAASPGSGTPTGTVNSPYSRRSLPMACTIVTSGVATFSTSTHAAVRSLHHRRLSADAPYLETFPGCERAEIPSSVPASSMLRDRTTQRFM